MLTSTAPIHTEDPAAITATTIAIDDVERRWRAALRDLSQLTRAAELGELEAADIEAELAARFTAHARELELHGEEIVDPLLWARYEARAAKRRAAAAVERRRSPRLRGLSVQARALCERQMCVVASARVATDVLRRLSADDDDEEALAVRRELGAAGLL